jgi:multicomponent Na+:H+ antiporter subunit B
VPQAAIVGASILAIALALAASRARSLPTAAAALSGLAFVLGIVAATLGVFDLALPLVALVPAVATAMFWRGAVLTRLREKVPFRPPLVALILAVVLAALMAAAFVELPTLGAADAPAATHVAPRYVRDASVETGARNPVAAVFGAYRAVDAVVLIAIVAAGATIGGLIAVPVFAPTAMRQKRRQAIGASETGRPRLYETVERLIDRGEALLGGAAPSRRGKAIAIAAGIGLSVAALALAWFHVDGTGGALTAGLAGGLAMTCFGMALRRRWGGAWAMRALALHALLGALGIIAWPVAANSELFDFAVFGDDFADGQRIGIRALTAALAVALTGFLAGHLVTIEEKPNG